MSLCEASNPLIDQNKAPEACSWYDVVFVLCDTHTWLSMRVIFTMNGVLSPQPGHSKPILTFAFVKQNTKRFRNNTDYVGWAAEAGTFLFFPPVCEKQMEMIEHLECKCEQLSFNYQKPAGTWLELIHKVKKNKTKHWQHCHSCRFSPVPDAKL